MEDEPIVDEHNREASELFFRILNNRDKLGRKSKSARRNGFVVLVREARTLHGIQKLCLDQDYNDCLTVRYRLRSGPVLGTLIRLFMSDLQQIHEDMPNIRGSFLPQASSEGWMELINGGFYDELREFKDLHSQDPGTLNSDWLQRFLRLVSDEKFFPTGHRLLIFGEVENAGTDLNDWELASRALFRILPERFGFVLLGAPEKFLLPANDPHFLDIVWHDDAAAEIESGDRADSFKVAALRDDQPANNDQLDVGDYAQGLARLILHEQTNPSLSAFRLLGEKGNPRS